jgi:hypothetical protein
MTYDITGVIHAYSQYQYTSCWGLEASDGYVYLFQSLPDDWKVEGKAAHVIGESWTKTGTCAMVQILSRGITITTIEPVQGGVCNDGQTKCDGTVLSVCNSGQWQSQGCSPACGCGSTSGIPVLPIVLLLAAAGGAYYYFVYRKKR